MKITRSMQEAAINSEFCLGIEGGGGKTTAVLPTVSVGPINPGPPAANIHG
jgi:hypothetical protein